LLKKVYEINMKDHTFTLLDTKGAMIANVSIIKNRMFLLNIKMDVLKCLNKCMKDETGL
jgi:tRNA pseudouridine-54 N-methylase